MSYLNSLLKKVNDAIAKVEVVLIAADSFNRSLFGFTSTNHGSSSRLALSFQ